MQSGRIAELADPKLEGKYDMDQMQRLVVTASYCVRQSSIWRPPMSKVCDSGIKASDSKSFMIHFDLNLLPIECSGVGSPN